MSKVCKWGEDIHATMSKRLQKYMQENPLCKKAPEYQGFCLHHLPHNLKLQREYELTSPKDRQAYLDLINSGKTIGEAYKTVGISFEAALEITNRAIQTVHFLSRTA